MSKRIIYTNELGIVSVIIPNDSWPGTLEELAAKDVPGDLPYKIIDEQDLPATREFRNAWVDVTPENSIDICCTKAKDLVLEKLRKERNDLLKESDIEYTIAMERGLDVGNIKTKRESLRDITNPLKALNTENIINDENLLQQIKDLAIIPENLKG